MAQRVLDDADVIEAARRVLKSAKTMVSQREFRRRVVADLQRSQPGATVGEERVRRLAAVQPFVRLELHSRRGSRAKVLTRCPVCDARLDRLKNQTLFGGEVTLTLRCPRCHYWSGKEKRVPTLYIFHYQGPQEAAPSLRFAADPGKPL